MFICFNLLWADKITRAKLTGRLLDGTRLSRRVLRRKPEHDLCICRNVARLRMIGVREWNTRPFWRATEPCPQATVLAALPEFFTAPIFCNEQYSNIPFENSFQYDNRSQFQRH